ncbi:YwqG family protein [Undibacterium sp. Ji49W]|uniref:YwqG family protein n=1 Tax=Undibacterium sp. Ji49W TaxID=3413040 RepID=UPI003BF36C12
MHIAFSHTGKFLLAQESDASAIIDLEGGLIANFDFPQFVNEHSPTTFSAEINYFPDLIITDLGVFILSQKNITHFSISELSWRSVSQPGKPAKQSEATRQASAIQATWKSFYKPSLELKPVSAADANAQRNSFMYGMPSMPDQQAWPTHAGQAMLLLCQLDLQEAALLLPANPFPDQGLLLFFVGVDKDFEVLLDDEFNPLATRVLWINQAAGKTSNAHTDMPHVESKHVEFVKGVGTWPQTDAAIVEAQLLSDTELEEYRSFLDEHQAESACGDTYRLGGYPTVLQQNGREAVAEYKRNGQYPKPDQNGWKTAQQWRLLLQVNSDDHFMWGTDSGILYFMIHESDLSVRDFSRVVSTAVGF